MNGRLNKEKYTEILNDHLLPVLPTLFIDQNGIFQHDNAPPHSSAHTTEWFADNHLTVLGWPAYSPDMNVKMSNKYKTANVKVQL